MAAGFVTRFLRGGLRRAAASLALLPSSRQGEALQPPRPSKQPLGLGPGASKGFASGLLVAFSGLTRAVPVAGLSAVLGAWAPPRRVHGKMLLQLLPNSSVQHSLVSCR